MTDSEHLQPASEEQVRLPREIGGYEVQRVLGSGGMATVYAALQKRPRRTVAVKVMQGAMDPEVSLRRFRREIEILGRLRHPYIAQVYEAGVHEADGGSVPFFVMEYIPGAKTIIEFAELKQLDLRQRLKLFIKVCAAVEHGHKRKIIHRDLKPGNILIDENGEPKIIDFGVARAVEIDLAHQTLQTEIGRLVGTVQYMAPEQLEKTPVDLDGRCDVYSLGVVLYKLLTGLPPHDLKGLPLFTAAQVIREDAPPRPSSIMPELKGDLETIILKALSKDRARRYRDAGQFGRDLLRFLASKPIQARRAGMRYRARLFIARHRIEMIAASIVVAVIAIAAGIVFFPESGPDIGRTDRPREDDVAVSGTPVAADRAEDGESPEPEAAPVTGFTLSGLATPVHSITIGPSNLIAAVADEGARVWSTADGSVTFAADPFEGRGIFARFARSSSRLALVSEFSETAIFDLETGESVARFSPVCENAFDAEADPEGERILICCSDLSLRLLGRDGATIHALRGTRGAFLCAAFSPGGGRFTGGAERGGVYVWDAASGRQIRQLEGLRDDVIAVALLADEEQVAAISDTGHGMIWSLADENQGNPFHVGLAPVELARFDATGRWVVCLSETGEIAALDLNESPPARVALSGILAESPTAIAIGREGEWCAFGLNSGVVRVTPVRWLGPPTSPSPGESTPTETNEISDHAEPHEEP